MEEVVEEEEEREEEEEEEEEEKEERGRDSRSHIWTKLMNAFTDCLKKKG